MIYQPTYLGLFHATAITGLQNMLTLHPEDALVALVLSSLGPMLQLRQRSHTREVVNAMREALGAKLWLPRHGGLYHIGNSTRNQAREVYIAMQEEGWEDRERNLKMRKREEALASKIKKNRRKRKESSRWGG